MSLHSAHTLDTLQEEAGTPRSKHNVSTQSPALRVKTGLYPKPSSGSSNGSKTIGLGIARRPSDNLLMNLAQEQQRQQGQPSAVVPPPSRKQLVSSNDRPLSNESILTQNSALFSSNPNSTASSSSDNSRGSSFIDDLSTDSVKRIGDETTFAETDGESTIDLTPTLGSEVSNSTHQSLVSAPPKTRYVFTNSSLTRSQVSFSASSPSPLKNNISPNAAPNKLFSKSTSALSQQQVLTPSQRYRLRKEKNKTALQNSIKQKEKFYEEQESPNTGGYTNESDIDNSLIWNIPVASNSTNSFLMSLKPPPKTTRSKSTGGFSRSSSQHSNLSESNSGYLDYHEMPPSPVPGLHKTSDFEYLQKTSESLSTIYQHSSNRFSQSKLWERNSSMEFLPMQFKTASDEGMEDLRLVSDDKVQLCSPSRPTWLPPKVESERKSHEEQINKTMSMASIDLLDKSREREERLVRDETNRQKIVLLIDRGLTRQSSLHNLKKIIWDTQLMPEVRAQVYDKILQSESRLISKLYIEPLRDISSVMDKMHFPRSKQTEIERLIARIPAIEELKDVEDLKHLLKLKSISSKGLLPGDELLFFHLLIDGSFSNIEQIWEMVNLIQLTCFNEVTAEKFDARAVGSRGVVAHYLCKNDEFKNEFNSRCLNIGTWWNVLQRVNHSLFMWCLDVIVAHNSQCFKASSIQKEKFVDKPWELYMSQHVVVNYKILVSMMLSVLLNYHFGFNDLISLADLQDKEFRIPCPMDTLLDDSSVYEVFVKKWRHYYKKF